jgi:PAT family beta-lactamase induction signal transducer AmpG
MLSAALIHENAHPWTALGPLLAGMFHEMRDLLRSRRTVIGLIFFLSPVGSAAVMNLISGVGPDYHASNQEVLWVTGVAGGMLCAFGSLIGGYVSSRMNRMLAYSLSGGLCAVFALAMALARPTPWSYGAGYAGYAIAAGFAFAVFTALVLDVIGSKTHAAGTAYALLVASGNLPIAYMTWVDGAGYQRAGVKGLMGFDAMANGGGTVLLLLVAAYARRFWRERA